MKRGAVKQIKQTLRKVFGLEELRPGQREVIEKVLNGEDVLAIMPTGAGKSLCYQLPGLHLEGMTLVVSPLISLMKDQTDKLDSIGIEAANLNSAVPDVEQKEALEDVANEERDFIFTTPERLADTEFLETIKDVAINFIVVDEAHCISQWGHDFRPAFLELHIAFQQLGSPPVLALTATATPEVIQDIRKQLDRPKMQVIHGGVFRENLKFEVIHTTNDVEKRAHLSRLLSEIQGSKIIYCATVKAVSDVSEELRSAGFAVESYHGKLSTGKRNEVQDKFMNGEHETIVATNAFGMGVDKADIRAVIHWQIPGTVEAYYQEAGRAGRDDKPARCILLYDTRDRRVQQFFMGGRYPSADDIALIYRTIHELSRSGTPPQLKQLQETIGDSIAKTKLRVGLNLLKDERIAREKRGMRFELIRPGLNETEISRVAESYTERGMTDREKLERMMLYAQSALCRWKILVEYFKTGEEIDKCGVCDNCVRPVEDRLNVAMPEPGLTTDDEKETLRKLRASRNDHSIQIGDIVRVPKIGEVQVKGVNDDKIDVVLPGGERKTFKAKFVKKVSK